ncbi:MAG: EAL domain-containing response regulator, partial [Usitatibacteraceae bacterium]
MSSTPTQAQDSALDAFKRGVLVVDDNPDQRDFFLRILPRVGKYDVVSAAGGVEALALLREDTAKIGLLICDLQMPGMDGMSLLRRIGEFRSDLAVIVLSSADSSILRSVELMGKAVGLRVLGSLQKPVDRVKLEKLLRQFNQMIARVPQTQRFVLGPDDLDRAFAQGELVPYFQPKVNVSTREVKSVEALARWIHPEQGTLHPEEFLPLVAACGKLAQLTDIIISASVRQVVDWRQRGCAMPLSVNLSLAALDNELFCEDAQALLAKHGMEPADLTFEILESAAMTNVGRSLEIITRLRLNGFGLAIDDFGTGFATFEQLSSMPFTELKIDRTFVLGAAQT